MISHEETYMCPMCSMACFIHVKMEIDEKSEELSFKNMEGFRCGRGKNFAVEESLKTARKILNAQENNQS